MASLTPRSWHPVNDEHDPGWSKLRYEDGSWEHSNHPWPVGTPIEIYPYTCIANYAIISKAVFDTPGQDPCYYYLGLTLEGGEYEFQVWPSQVRRLNALEQLVVDPETRVPSVTDWHKSGA